MLHKIYVSRGPSQEVRAHLKGMVVLEVVNRIKYFTGSSVIFTSTVYSEILASFKVYILCTQYHYHNTSIIQLHPNCFSLDMKIDFKWLYDFNCFIFTAHGELIELYITYIVIDSAAQLYITCGLFSQCPQLRYVYLILLVIINHLCL